MELINNPVFPLLLFVFLIFLGLVVYLPEAIPGFIFLSFASIGVVYEITNISKINLFKAFLLPLLLFILLMTKIRRRESLPWVNILLVTLFICSVIISMNINALSFEITRPYIGTMLIALVVALSPRAEKTAKYTLLAFALWGFLNLLATFSQLAGHGWMYRGDAIHTRFRVQGLMGSSTMMGIYFVIAMVSVHILYLEEKYRSVRVLLFCLGACFTIGVLGTLSRASIIAGALSYMFIQAQLGKLRFGVLLGIVASLGLIFGLAALLNLDEMAMERFSVIHRDPSSQYRFRLAEAAVKYFEMYPLWGLGLSQGGMEAKNVIINSHNTFLQRLLENGVIGFTLFAAMLWRAIRGYGKRIADNILYPSAYRSGLRVILIAILINGMFHDFSYLMPLWLVIGMGLML